MNIEVRPLTKELLQPVADLARRHGIPRSLRWYRRCLYLPCDQQDAFIKDRGFVAVREDGTCAAVQCHHPTTVYFNRAKIPVIQKEVLAADKDGGGYVFDILTACDQEEGGIFCYNNDTATVNSIALAKKYSGFASGPAETGVVHFCWADLVTVACVRFLRNRPRKTAFLMAVWKPFRKIIASIKATVLSAVSGLKFKLVDSIDKAEQDLFFSIYLKSSTGIVAPRDGQMLIEKFQESISAGTVSMFNAYEKGAMVGYILVRHYPQHQHNAHEIIDIIALNNDQQVLKALVRRARCHAVSCGVRELRIVAALPKSNEWLFPLLKRTRPLVGISFMYRTKNEEIISSLKNNDGWFFGPYDGERCLGYGGYVDL